MYKSHRRVKGLSNYIKYDSWILKEALNDLVRPHQKYKKHSVELWPLHKRV